MASCCLSNAGSEKVAYNTKGKSIPAETAAEVKIGSVRVNRTSSGIFVF
jgi:hypothetical protein